MTTTISRLIQAPIEDVFSFFDDPSSTLEFNPHASGSSWSTSSRTVAKHTTS